MYQKIPFRNGKFTNRIESDTTKYYSSKFCNADGSLIRIEIAVYFNNSQYFKNFRDNVIVIF